MKTNVYRLTMVILCVAGIFFTGQRAAAQGLTISIADQISVTGAYFTLGDIAGIFGEDSERTASLRQFQLGRTPPPGQSAILTKDVIIARLSGAKIDVAGITWQMPPQVRVTALAQTVSGQQLASQAEKYLTTALNGADVTITVSGQPQDILVPPGYITYKIESPYGLRFNAPTTVSIGILVDGQLFTTTRLRFDIRKYEQVAVTNRALAAHEPITADSISFERRDIGRLPPGYFTSLNKILGLSARRQLAPGTAITDNVLEKPILIKRGKPVSIVAKTGGIEITAAGIALQNGTEGQFIRVQNANSKKIITGRVVDEATVQINL